MNGKRSVLGITVLLTVAALTGCAPLSGDASSAPAASAVAGESTASDAKTVDAQTCTAFSDVLTIVANADAGLREGRMAEQEQQGWYRVATRVLDRLPTRGEGAVSDAIAMLKKAAPATPPAAMGQTGIGSGDWDSGTSALSGACSVAGVEMSLEMFTGG